MMPLLRAVRRAQEAQHEDQNTGLSMIAFCVFTSNFFNQLPAAVQFSFVFLLLRYTPSSLLYL
jgi:hypothetical protein